MRLKTLVESVSSFQYLGGLKLKTTTAFRIGLTMKNVQTALEVHDKARRELIQDIGKPDPEHPDRMVISQENRPVYEREYRKLLEEKVPVKITRINLEKDFDGMELAPSSIYQLMNWFIELGATPSMPLKTFTNKEISEVYGCLVVLGSQNFDIPNCKKLVVMLRSFQKIVETQRQKIVGMQIDKRPETEINAATTAWNAETSEVPIAIFSLAELEKLEVEAGIYSSLTFMISDQLEMEEAQDED